MGSHASEDIHLAGIYEDETDKITQSFCMKTIPVRDGDYYWQKGNDYWLTNISHGKLILQKYCHIIYTSGNINTECILPLTLKHQDSIDFLF